jgi:hypothetical protein
VAVRSHAKFPTLEERLPAYGSDVAQVIRRVLYEEQRKLGLKNPKDIVTLVEKIIEDAVTDSDELQAGDA